MKDLVDNSLQQPLLRPERNWVDRDEGQYWDNRLTKTAKRCAKAAGTGSLLTGVAAGVMGVCSLLGVAGAAPVVIPLAIVCGAFAGIEALAGAGAWCSNRFKNVLYPKPDL
jgi:hypothetical protein